MTSRRSALRAAGPAVVAIGVVGAGVLTTGTAMAFWSTTGSGTGTAGATTARALQLEAPASVGSLYPGGGATGTVTVQNPNGFPVTVTAATFGATSAGSPACTTTGVAFSPAPAALPMTVPAHGSAPFTYTAAMTNASQSTCQGSTFAADLTLTASSSAP